MIHDIVTVMRKEWKEIMALGGAYRGRFQLIVLLGLLGIFMPLQMGPDWVHSPATVATWSWVPVLLVSTIVADSFAGERERHTLETLLASRLSDTSILFGKLGAAIGYGWILSMVALLMGLVTVNVANRGDGLSLYPRTMALSAVVLSFLGAALASGLGVLVSLRAQTVRQAQQTMSIAMMALFLLPVLGAQAIPDDVKHRAVAWATEVGATGLLLGGMGVLAAVDVVLVAAARARFRRGRLVES